MIGLALVSCDLIGPVDDIKPQYQLEEDNVIRDAKSAELAVNGVYQTWRAWDLCVFRVHMSLYCGSVSRTGPISGENGFLTNEVEQNNTAVAGIYRTLYGVLNSANFIIDLLQAGHGEDLADLRRREMIGECKFHRALAHLTLLRLFGQFWNQESALGIVLREKPYRESDIAARNTVAACFASIVNDLNDAMAEAPDQPQSHAYVSRIAAKALQSRVMLTMGDYEKAASLSAEVIRDAEAKGYTLAADWLSVFSAGWSSSEVLFAPYTFNTEKCDASFDRTGSSVYSASLAAYWGEQGGLATDPRYEAAYTAEGFRKYPYGSSTQVIGNGYFMLRLPEVYLIHAEAEARQQHYSSARQSLQVIAARAGYLPSVVDNIPDTALPEAIRQHKWLELFGECYEEWFDLVRYHTAGDIAISSVRPGIVSDNQLVLPIPEEALIANRLLIPNPGQK